ncbi:MAG TPA: ribosome-associated translation inhibitor RaiA [Chthoniobacteraceae bacterium]|nr:ribosome-associated translation inhibitor RaiA [Chthoniobacteraceae bacterium]
MQTSNVNLPIKVTGRHVSITAAIKDYAVKKVEGLHLDYPKIIEAQVILNVEKYRHSAEVILVCGNHITIEATSETDDMYGSIDQVIGKIAQQMRKYKTKIMRSHRDRRHTVRHIEEQVLSLEEGYADTEESEPTVIHSEKYPVKPMFVDEAVLQLEMSSRQFVVFLNAKSEKVNVLYRRKSQDFGLIEPVFA